MATSLGLDKFGKRLLRIGRRYGARVEAAVKRSAGVADRTAVLATPVDTGRARSGWVPSLNIQVEQERFPIEAGQPGSPGRARANNNLGEIRTRVSEYDIDEDRGIFLTNIVPYILKLDRGSSAQAPSGMSALAIQAGAREAARARPLKEATRGN